MIYRMYEVQISTFSPWYIKLCLKFCKNYGPDNLSEGTYKIFNGKMYVEF